MNKKFLSIILAIVLTITSLITLPTNTQAASYKSAYKKALTTTISGGIYSKYAYIKMKGFSKPVMMVIMNEWDRDYDYTHAQVSFYFYKNGKVKRIGSFFLNGGERDDWKLRRKGKKYVLYPKNNTSFDASYYVLKKKNGKVKGDWYIYESARFGNPATYSVNSKTISKSKFNKAVKTTKKVKVKTHFAEHE